MDAFAAFSVEYQAAFEYNEFFNPLLLDDETEKAHIIRKYLGIGRDCSDDTLHGAFLDICVNSSDPLVFRASDYRVRQCMDIARRMGLKAVVFHTNYIVNFRLRSYLDTWLGRNEEYWRKILKAYPEQMVYMENMFDDSPDLLMELAQRMADEPRFAVCLDTAHAMISGSPLEPWLSAMRAFVRHVHINDNDGTEDLHLPVGSGVFTWNLYDSWIRSFQEKPSVLIEVRGFKALKASVEFMEGHNLYPFDA